MIDEDYTGEIVEADGHMYKLIARLNSIDLLDVPVGCIVLVSDRENGDGYLSYWAQPVEDLDKQWPKRRGKCSP